MLGISVFGLSIISSGDERVIGDIVVIIVGITDKASNVVVCMMVAI